MRVTFLGHVGMYIETEGGSVLCDPWFTPAYFGSWFPFPRNDTLDTKPFTSPDYLYISHLHRDHFDPEWLRAHVDKTATVLLPAFHVDHLERALLQFDRDPKLAPAATQKPADLDEIRPIRRIEKDNV